MKTTPKRVMVIGARGLLGTPTAAAFRRSAEVEVDGVDLPDLDITEEQQVEKRVAAFRPDLVINCAAYTAVDACETNEETASRVNGLGAGFVARAAAHHGSRMIHISTDYVFEGDAKVPYREDHPPAPPERLSAYGRSKLLGERQVQAHHRQALIVRTAWLYGPNGLGFPNAILRRAREIGRLQVVNDQRGSPTYAPDLADALFRLGQLEVTGIFHVTNSGECTWYEYACEILRLAGIQIPIAPVTTAEFPRPARRPAFSVLDNRRYIEATGAPLRSWREALAEYITSCVMPGGLR